MNSQFESKLNIIHKLFLQGLCSPPQKQNNRQIQSFTFAKFTISLDVDNW